MLVGPVFYHGVDAAGQPNLGRTRCRSNSTFQQEQSALSLYYRISFILRACWRSRPRRSPSRSTRRRVTATATGGPARGLAFPGAVAGGPAAGAFRSVGVPGARPAARVDPARPVRGRHPSRAGRGFPGLRAVQGLAGPDGWPGRAAKRHACGQQSIRRRAHLVLYTIYIMRIIEGLTRPASPLVRGLPAGLTAAYVRCGACHSSWPHRAVDRRPG